MVKKVVAATAAVLILLVIGIAVWARSILATDTVRTAIAAQISKAIGQPVAIGGIGASIFPTVTIDLEQVTIGQPPRIEAETLHVATNFRALLSRRIEHGAVRLSKARVELPLPAFGERRTSRERTCCRRGGRRTGRDRLHRRDCPERRRNRERVADPARRHRGFARGTSRRVAIDRSESGRHVDHSDRAHHRSVGAGRRAEHQGRGAEPRPVARLRDRLRGRCRRAVGAGTPPPRIMERAGLVHRAR